MTPPHPSTQGHDTDAGPLSDPLAYPAVDIPQLPLTGDRPVVAIDIDGVLNPMHAHSPLPPTAVRTPVCLPAWATSKAAFLRGHGHINLTHEVVVDTAHGDWIRSLLERDIHVVWCTSWETAAPVVYGHLLGLPPLPVITLEPLFGSSSTAADAKADALCRSFPDRTLVWIDDQSGCYRHGFGTHWAQRSSAYAAYVPDVDPDSGLTAAIRTGVDAFLARHPQALLTHPHTVHAGSVGTWKITTTKGTLTLTYDDPADSDGRIVADDRLLGSVRRTRQLAGYRLDVDITVGHRLSAVGTGYRSTRAVPLGVVTDIELLAPFPSPPDRPRFVTVAAPELVYRRDAQAAAQTAATAFGIDAVAVRAGDTLTFTDICYEVRVNLHGDGFLITATTRRDLHDNGVRYFNEPVAALPARSVLHTGTRTREHRIDYAQLMTASVNAVRDWHRQLTCTHSGTSPFCSHCGHPDPTRNLDS